MITARHGVDRFFELSVLGLVASGFLAVAGSGNLDLPTIALVSFALAVRCAMAAGWIRMQVPEGVALALAGASILFYPADLQWLSGEFIPATVHLVSFLVVIRVLTAKSTRDYVYTAALSLLELLAAALMSNQMNFFAFLALYLLFAIAALASGEIRRASAQPGQVARGRRLGTRLSVLTAGITVAVLGMSAFLFFLLPRTASAALRRMTSRGLVVPGFSGQVTLGQIGEVKSNTAPVMHVKVEGQGRLPQPVRWRGATLNEFDGRQWKNVIVPVATVRVQPGRLVFLATGEQRAEPGKRVGYTVDLKQLDTNTLFFAGNPEVLQIPATHLVRGDDGSIRATVDGLSVRYFVYANFDAEPGGELRQMQRYLALPGLDPRVEVTAREWTSSSLGIEAKARAIERELKTQYAYTLDLPDTLPADPLGDFLFERRKGHCEYFASAMAVMLRTLGIPSRLVTGFYGGTENPVSGQWIVRASDAHSWVEAWLPDRGWTAFDPTPPDPRSGRTTLWSQLGMYIDAAETFWQDWVVGYDLGQQAVLAERVNRAGRRAGWDWLLAGGADLSRAARQAGTVLKEWMPSLVAGAAAGVALFLWGPGLWRRVTISWRARKMREGEGSAEDATLLYHRFLDVMRGRGFEKPSWLTPDEFCQTLTRAPELSGPAARFTHLYQALRFGGERDAAPRLSAMLNELEAAARGRGR